jgi:glycerophosphoryl diester phosphodiesterase
VLPVQTYAGPPQSGAFVIPGPGEINGITFPLPEQPVEGFSAIVKGRHAGEYLAMPDNGFGSKSNSVDFLLRAYYLRIDFKTAQDPAAGQVEVGDFISFRDPDRLIGFPIVREDTTRRLLTGGDVDPESLQRGRHGDLWVGDEFGPWILHFSATGRLLEPPFAMPAGLMSPNNPFLNGQPPTHPNSRGLEGMAITPDRKRLYAALEGATAADLDPANPDADPSRRHLFVFDTRTRQFSDQVLQYRTEAATNLIADMWAVSQHRLVLIERDGGRGVTATFRRVYLIDVRRTDPSGTLLKTMLVDLTSIPDPDLVSLPEIHPGDLGLGDPFWVMCESVEAIHLIGGRRLMIGCDNNFPNTGRNPTLADDSEFITVRVPGLRHTCGRQPHPAHS